MWNVKLTEHLNSYNLDAAYEITTYPCVNRITMYKYREDVCFNIFVADYSSLELLYKIFNELYSLGVSELEKKITEGEFVSILSFSVLIKNDLILFHKIMNLLDVHVQNFKELLPKISILMQSEKNKIVLNEEENRLIFYKDFENDAENTMYSPLYISTRESELKIINKYSFPAPGPGFCIKTENKLIQNIISALEDKQNYYLQHEYLTLINDRRLEGVVVLSNKSREILESVSGGYNIEDVETARKALNVYAALRSVMLGSHSHNYIDDDNVGFNFRNLVAMMWHCCITLRNENRFIPGVFFDDAFNALILGIANGARGGNRNGRRYDDLSYDKPSCNRGRFNALISAFNGVFEEVNIIYNHIDLLLDTLKEFIILEIIDFPYVNNFYMAKQYLDAWLGIEDLSNVKEYISFVAAVNSKVRVVMDDFINANSSNNSAHARLLKESILDDVDRVEKSGFNYIEMVSPSHVELEKIWGSCYNLTNKQHNSACKPMF